LPVIFIFGNIANFYANHAQGSMTVFEIRLVLSYISGVNPETKRLMALQTMLVSMSPELAELVHKLLGNY
jgi:hypothetical protein